MDSASEKPLFDEKLAARYVGKLVLIGVTHLDERGQPVRQEQLHGRIASVSKGAGFEVKLEGVNAGKTFWLPPDLRSTTVAQPGEYSLRSTGEVVNDPDLLATWIMRPKDPSGWHRS